MKAERPSGLDRITQDPKVMVGKPVVRGTRIPVELILGHLAHNPDLAELFAAYPELTIEDVKAVLAYAQAAVGRGRGQRRQALAAALGSQG
jgi:uncharacterized protein (DUF433 family)